jgi:hypothetical protein
VHDCGRNCLERQSKKESFVDNFRSDVRNTEVRNAVEDSLGEKDAFDLDAEDLVLCQRRWLCTPISRTAFWRIRDRLNWKPN